jgi:HSP20 family molecular chaperone IbpA
VVPEKTTAEYKNGILAVTLVKKTPTKPESKGFEVNLK